MFEFLYGVFEFLLGIALIVVVVVVVVKYLNRQDGGAVSGKYLYRQNRSSVPGEVEERLNARLDNVDRRLTDIQEVMIAIDEKLERKDSQGAS